MAEESSSGVGGFIGDLVSPVLGFVNDLFGRKYNAREAEKNRDFQRSERLATQEFNLEMWNKNNEYNSLESQIERAKEAGVNPNVLLNGKAGGSTSSPVVSSPMSGSMSSFNSSLSPVLAQLGKTFAEKDLIQKQAKSVGDQNDFFNMTKDLQIETMQKNLQGLDASIKRDLSQTELNNANSRTINESFGWIRKFNEVELNTRLEALNKLRNENLGVILNNQLTNEKIESENIAQQGAKIDNYGKVLDNEGKETENALLAIKKKFSDATGLPLGTSEFEVQYMLWKEGKLEGYIRDVMTPVAQSSWKPMDFRMDAGSYNFGFNPSKSIKSPQYYGSKLDRAEKMEDKFDKMIERTSKIIGVLNPFK